MALMAFVLVGFYVSTYVVHRFSVPLGWDSPGYAWRTELGKAFGAAALPQHIPQPGPVNPGRPGFVVVGGLLSSVLGVHPLRLAEVLPGLMAAAAALAAGVAVSVARRSRWEGAAVALGVGTSMFMVRAINVEGYQDNIQGLALFAASLTPILLAMRDRRAVIPAALLIGATGLAHWNVMEIGLAVIGLTALVYLPAAVRAVRVEGRNFTDTAVVRLTLAAAAGAGLAWAGIVGVLSAPLPSPRVDIGQFIGKVRRDLPAYGLPFTLGAAGVGAVALAGSASERDQRASGSRALLVLMLAWCQVTVLAFVGEWSLGKGIPGHRVLAICLAIPILGVIGLSWLGGWVGKRKRALGTVLVLVGLAGSAYLGQAEWSSYRPVMKADQLVQSETAARYLDGASVAAGRPVIFVVDTAEADAWSEVWLAAHTLRAGLPPDRIQSMYVFVGGAEDYLAKRPSSLPPGPPEAAGISPSEYRSISGLYFSALVPTYDRWPVVLILASTSPEYASWTSTHPGSEVGPGVAVVRGPVLSAALLAASNPVAPPSLPDMVWLAAAGLAILMVAGGGWTVAMLGRWTRGPEAAALSIAVGAAALLAGGVLLDATGLALSGWKAYAIVVLVSGGGWSAALIRRHAAAGPRP